MNYVSAIVALLAILTAATLGCGPKSSSPAAKPTAVDSVNIADNTDEDGGSQDPGGGGGIQFSTSDQVIEAANRARAFLESEKGTRFLKVHLHDSVPQADTESGRAVKEALSKLTDGNLKSKLAQSTIEFKIDDSKKSNCAPKKLDAYPDAYISELKLGASICFNVQRLRRLPAENLYRNMISLWVHEATHLHGYGESVSFALGELASVSIERLGHLYAWGVFPIIQGQIRSSIDSIANMQKPNHDLLESLRSLRKSAVAIRGFIAFINQQDKVFALDDRYPVLHDKAGAFEKAAKMFYATAEALAKEQEAGRPIPVDQAVLQVDHQLACVTKALYGIMDSLKYPKFTPLTAWTGYRSEVGNYQNAVCD